MTETLGGEVQPKTEEPPVVEVEVVDLDPPVALVERTPHPSLPSAYIEPAAEQLEVLKAAVCPSTPLTDVELTLYLATCKRTGLDPMMRQIYVFKRRPSRPRAARLQVRFRPAPLIGW